MPLVKKRYRADTWVRPYDFYFYIGTGILKTKTIIHVPLPRFKSISPHGVGIIDLDEEVSISGLLLDDPEIGQRVKAVYLEDGDKKLLAFKPV